METRYLKEKEKIELRKYLTEFVGWKKQEIDDFLTKSIRPSHHWTFSYHKEHSAPGNELQIIDWHKEIEISQPYFSDVKVGDKVWDYDRGWATVESVKLDFDPSSLWYQESPLCAYFDDSTGSGHCYNLNGGEVKENTTDYSEPYVATENIKSQRLFWNSFIVPEEAHKKQEVKNG